MSLRVVLAAVVDDCLTIFCEHFCRKSTDLSWDGDEPSSAAPPVEEAAPETQATTEPPATEAPLPEAVVVEGEYPS
jgi:hypothetical protein